MGFGDEIKEVENAVDGQTYVPVFLEDSIHSLADRTSSAQQQTQNKSDSGIDTVLDSAVDGLASREGVSAALDPEINNVVNDEVNKFL
ncbi:uncharacterized protein SPSK_04681 [Sporothrix schenckii 1099-18]|uniref:Uncharacterized protein n=1 Tax=Sporothrix schenckii 1099-18 TaxID=1397361 RepID=A0A0F2M158_SPOSC|nr:uncharacterized protein SPSK_04681 [Sporothrix schenckii 1099-18]KJR82834.1 hypothetical protein SPSK_04681 [Sporothrix schenckii 1099-18]